MVLFSGRLQGPDLEPSSVSIDIGDGRLRISAGRRQLGSWPLEKIKSERRSIYRFGLDIDGDKFDFVPDDPSRFSDEVGAIIDLTSGSRFGLKERLERSSGL